MLNATVRYTSNVKGLGEELDARLEQIVGRAARDGANWIRGHTNQPTIKASAGTVEKQGSMFVCPITVPSGQFYAIMFDKGTLGQREIPLKYPNKRKTTWTQRRRQITGSKADRTFAETSREITFHRQQKALETGGVKPRYFYIRGKRVAEQALAGYLQRGI